MVKGFDNDVITTIQNVIFDCFFLNLRPPCESKPKILNKVVYYSSKFEDLF